MELTEKREKMLSRMIRIYGFEHEVVVQFAELLETDIDDQVLETIVKTHENYPLGFEKN